MAENVDGHHPPKVKELVEELHDVKTKWKIIGTQLEIPRATLQSIEANNHDTEEAFTEMMHEWLQRSTDPAPSWSAIVEALRSRSVGEVRLAKNIKINHCSSVQEVTDGHPAAGFTYMHIAHADYTD